MFLASCSQAPKKPSHEEYFVTHILTDGTKMFSYNLITDQSQRSHKRGQKSNEKPRGNDRGGGSSRDKNRKNMGYKKRVHNQGGFKQKRVKRFYKDLEHILQENNYCRKGYIELHSSFDKKSAELRGQCNEKANQIDRAVFKNQ